MDPHRISSSQNCMSSIGNCNNPREQLSMQGQLAISILLYCRVYITLHLQDRLVCVTNPSCYPLSKYVHIIIYSSHNILAALQLPYQTCEPAVLTGPQFAMCKNLQCCSFNNLLPATVYMIIDSCLLGFVYDPSMTGC